MAHPLPFFSVITTTHLRAPLLERALQSLRQQSFQDFEMIVVADALDAGTARVAAELLRAQDVFVKRNGAPGPAESRNLGMDMARGEWVLFLDDDDSFQPQHLQTLHRRITQPASEAERAARVLYSDFEVLTEDRTQQPLAALSRSPVSLKAHAVANLHVKNFIPNNALAFHRLVLEGCRVDP
ncbi:MAG TPA: glycosyltransferase family A protein, partial [Burkholderiaceae bacterium]|nr:glycosyltransferase family A protein [Burkholderiaceae bacterium]